MPKAGFVYLLACNEGYCKIGRSANPTARLERIKTLPPFDIRLVHVIDAGDMCGAEEALHDRFARKRRRGEWFKLSPIDVWLIKSLATYQRGQWITAEGNLADDLGVARTVAAAWPHIDDGLTSLAAWLAHLLSTVLGVWLVGRVGVPWAISLALGATFFGAGIVLSKHKRWRGGTMSERAARELERLRRDLNQQSQQVRRVLAEVRRGKA